MGRNCLGGIIGVKATILVGGIVGVFGAEFSGRNCLGGIVWAELSRAELSGTKLSRNERWLSLSFAANTKHLS